MKTPILCIVAFISISNSIACECAHRKALEYFMAADFVATARIERGFVNDNVEVYYDVEEYWVSI